MNHQAFLEDVVLPWKIEYDGLPRTNAAPGKFRLVNNYFGSVDAEVMYAVVRHLKPSRIIEIGSGWSTLLIREAIEANDLACDLMSIDPSPIIPDLKNINRNRLAVVDPGVFSSLQRGDIVSFDGSHKWEKDGDVDLALRVILPSLQPGVWVHFHDIFLPDPYIWPDRDYDEQDHLQRWLDGMGEWTVLFSAHQAMKSDPEGMKAAFASATDATNPGSFWMTWETPPETEAEVVPEPEVHEFRSSRDGKKCIDCGKGPRALVHRT